MGKYSIVNVCKLPDSGDITHSNLLLLFEKIYLIVDKHITLSKDSTNIHINCYHGRNRSVTFFVFLFMKRFDMTPIEAFKMLQSVYLKIYHRIPKFLVSNLGVQGVAFLDWYYNNHKQSLSERIIVEEFPEIRRSKRTKIQSDLAIEVSKGDVDMISGYICEVIHGGIHFFVSDLKAARNVVAQFNSEIEVDTIYNGNILIINLSGSIMTNTSKSNIFQIENI